MTRTATIDRPLVLASASPRRRELLGLLGLVFGARAAQVEESPAPDEAAIALVQRLAREKAAAVARQMSPQSYAVVIGADTIVVLDGETLGKPRDAVEAVSILQRLRGREHRVYTALSIHCLPLTAPVESLACTCVPMRPYSDREILNYVRSGDPFDKAGAYAIQNAMFRPVERLTGCYANVMGLPLCHLFVALQEIGIDTPVDPPKICQSHLGYRCPIYAEVLAGPTASCTGQVRMGESG